VNSFGVTEERTKISVRMACSPVIILNANSRTEFQYCNTKLLDFSSTVLHVLPPHIWLVKYSYLVSWLVNGN
jgi:hypothetical protein